MEHEIVVGILVGAIVVIGPIIYHTNRITQLQKFLVIPLLLVLPVGLLLYGIFVYFNNQHNDKSLLDRSKENDSVNEKNNQTENKEIADYDVSISNLENLKDKGLLSLEEYNNKLEIVENERLNKEVLNSVEYKQLESIYATGLLTKEEFEDKVSKIKAILSNQKNESKPTMRLEKIERRWQVLYGYINEYVLYFNHNKYYFYEVEKTGMVFISVKGEKQYFKNRKLLVDKIRSKQI